jgi:4-hydroxybenzoate polyprenyltransferase
MNAVSSNDRLTPPLPCGGAFTRVSRGCVPTILQALRLQQWLKNLLLLAPVFLAHKITDFDRVRAGAVAFIAFSLCASATYVINDLLDIEADRRHPLKSHRPFAAGKLPFSLGPPLALLLMVSGLTVSILLLSWTFFAALVVYLIGTLTYSFWLKRIVLVDILLLSGMYTLRLIAGGVATAAPVSEWLLLFSMFFFTSLALVKRYAELARLGLEGEETSAGRGYVVSDLGFVEQLGAACGYLAVLVFALYINGDAVKQLYVHLWALWVICPLLFYWVSRLWLLARHRALIEDPVVFALKDRVSLGIGALTVLLVIIATGLR